MAVIPLRTDAPQNAFRHFWNLGWRRLLPLYPADAQIENAHDLSEATLNQRLGKAPAQRLGNGQWVNLKGWSSYRATEQDIDRWHAWGANVGMVLDDDWFVFDIDIQDAQWADEAERIITGHLGEAPCRIGLAPKRMLFYRMTEPFPMGAPIYATTRNGEEKIELFGKGRNVAIYGTHRKAGRAMAWPRQPIAADMLPRVTQTAYEACCAAIVAALPGGTRSRTHEAMDDREAIDQSTLRAKHTDTLRSAVEAIRNTRKDFGGYDDWVRLAAAIRGAVGEEGFYDGEAMFVEFSERSDIHDMTESPERVYRSVQPPFGVGAGYVYDLALRHGWNNPCALASEFFEPVIEAEPSPFDIQAMSESAEADSDVFPVLRLGDIEDRPPPRFLIDRYIPQVSTGFLYSAPGIGKSFLALDMALHLAFGLPDWHGDKIDLGDDAPGVLYLAAEGSFGFRNRVRAWRKVKGVPKEQANSFAMIERTIDFMDPGDIDKLIRTVTASGMSRPAMIIVDTVSRAMPGADENLQKEMTLFVKACDRVKDAFQCAVMGVHHAGKSGDMRGSTVLRGAGDFVFKLEREKGRSVGHLTCEKQKDGPDGWSEPYVFDPVDLGDGQTSLVASRAALPGGNSGPMTPTVAALILAAMQDAWNAGAPWGKTARSGDSYAISQIVRGFGIGAEQAEQFVRLWVADGTIRLSQVDSKSKRVGYEVLRDGGGHGSAVSEVCLLGAGDRDGENVFE